MDEPAVQVAEEKALAERRSTAELGRDLGQFRFRLAVMPAQERDERAQAPIAIEVKGRETSASLRAAKRTAAASYGRLSARNASASDLQPGDRTGAGSRTVRRGERGRVSRGGRGMAAQRRMGATAPGPHAGGPAGVEDGTYMT